MAQGLPYFKFYPSEWMTGNIFYEDLETQGLFINICALYWHRDGILTVEDINIRFKKPAAFTRLSQNFLTVKEGLLTIPFLDEQLTERRHLSMVNSVKGSKGGRPKTVDTIEEKTRSLTDENPQLNRKKPIRIRIRSRSNIKEVDIYTFENCLMLFAEKTKTNWDAEFSKTQANIFYNFYASKNWMVGKNKMKSVSHAIGGWISRVEPPKATPVSSEDEMLKQFRMRGF